MLQIFLTFVITILIAYLFGIILVNLIDNRLNKLKINTEEHYSNKKEKKEDDKKIIEYKTYNFDTGEELNEKGNFGIEGYTNNKEPDNLYKTWKYESKNDVQTCIKDHQHVKDGRSTKCTYGITNFADPVDMSPVDLRIFTLNYSPNMTMQDYINWLWCFKGREDQLPYNHLKNLEKMKMGKKLIPETGVCPPPAYYYPPLDAEQYFNKMYNIDSNEFNIAGPLNSITGPMLGYNYNDYSEFSQNNKLYGVSGDLRNPDIPLKVNAKKLYDNINPKDSNNLEIEKKYEIYHIKDVEI